MGELVHYFLEDNRAAWIKAGRPLPLEVSRARYDDPMPRSWEVLYTESPWDYNSGSSAPIAEFTEWAEAQEWALAEARKSTRRDDSRQILGPRTAYQQAHFDAWEAYEAGTGPHPFTTENERQGLR